MKANGERVSNRASVPALAMVMAVFVLTACLRKEPIQVGFAAELTGSQAELGVQERNGVELAFEQVNGAGGISGRQLVLLVRNDLGTAEGARRADGELIRAGVVAIIGHATSQQTIRGREVTEAAQVVLISPTTSTPDLTGIDDNFFRITPTFKERTAALTQRLFERGAKRVALIYDTDNAAFTDTEVVVITSKLESLGGKVVSRTSFSARSTPDFHSLVVKMRDSDATGVFIIAPDAEAALIAQQIRLLDWKATLACTGWALTATLLQNGGKAVEGMLGTQSYDMSSAAPALREFKARFQARFGRPATFGAAFAYETAKVLAAALQKTGGKAQGLKRALLETRDFQGLISPITFDPFGDVIRPSYLMEIRNLQIVSTDTLAPELPTPKYETDSRSPPLPR